MLFYSQEEIPLSQRGTKDLGEALKWDLFVLDSASFSYVILNVGTLVSHLILLYFVLVI